MSDLELPTTTPGQALAVAICYILAAAPSELDFTGEIGASLWPFDVAEYEPDTTALGNIRLSVEWIQTALLLSGAGPPGKEALVGAASE